MYDRATYILLHDDGALVEIRKTKHELDDGEDPPMVTLLFDVIFGGGPNREATEKEELFVVTAVDVVAN